MVLDSRWWVSEALRKLVTTTDTGDVKLVCSFVPFVDEKTLIVRLSVRSDLGTLFTLHCRGAFPEEQRADILLLTDGCKAKEVWRVLRFLSAHGNPWDWNWQPTLTGDPQEIAD